MMSTKFVKKIFSAVMVAVFVLSTAVVPMELTETTVYAATATVDVTNGRCIYTNAQGQEVQLTRSLVTKDALIASDSTVYMEWENGSLYFYSPQYSKGNKVTYITDGVISISASGYETTTSGHKNYLTESEIKSKLGLDGNSNGNNGNGGNSNGNGNGNNGGNSNGTNSKSNGISRDGKNIIFSDGKYSYVVTSDGDNVTQYFMYNKKVFLRYANGDIQSWDTEKKDKLTVAKGTTGLVYDSQNNIIGFYDNTGKVIKLTDIPNNSGSAETPIATTTLIVNVNTDQKSVSVVPITNGTYASAYVLTLNDKNRKIAWAYPDKNSTVYIRDDVNNLYVWNYTIQKDNLNAVVNAKIATNVSTAIAVDGIMTGYVVGNTTQPTWSLDQVKVAISMAATNNATDNNGGQAADDNTTKIDRAVKRNTYTMLYDTKNNKVSQFRFTKKKLYFKGLTIKKVKNASFVKNGNVVFVKTNGNAYMLDKSTLDTKLIGKSVRCFAHNSKGFAVKTVRKDGTKKAIKL